MRIEKVGDVVSFDGGTMTSRQALDFAIKLANIAWDRDLHKGGRKGAGALTLCTVEEAIAIRDIAAAQSVYPDIPQNPLVGDIRRDRFLLRLSVDQP